MTASFQVTFDAHDPLSQAEFWADALDYIVQPPPEGYDTWDEFADAIGIPLHERGDLAAVVDRDGVMPRLLFARVPEDKVVKNRVHLDVNVTEPAMDLADRRRRIDAEVQRLVELGATKVADRGDHSHTWTVLLDPEGNEFCIQ